MLMIKTFGAILEIPRGDAGKALRPVARARREEAMVEKRMGFSVQVGEVGRGGR